MDMIAMMTTMPLAKRAHLSPQMKKINAHVVMPPGGNEAIAA